MRISGPHLNFIPGVFDTTSYSPRGRSRYHSRKPPMRNLRDTVIELQDGLQAARDFVKSMESPKKEDKKPPQFGGMELFILLTLISHGVFFYYFTQTLNTIAAVADKLPK